MTATSQKQLFVFIFFSLSLSACSVSLAADVPPPAGYTPPAPATPAAVNVTMPFVPADPSQGKAIYAEKCAPCHGQTGMGDGPQAVDLPNPVPVLGRSELKRDARPLDWFEMVSKGNLERFMPPFEGSLSDRQRWDVVAYVFTLGVSETMLKQGQELYQAQCQSCHGEKGRGDGPQAAALERRVPNWRDPTRLVQWSNQQLWEVISNGAEPDMPAFQDNLDEAQRWALAAYVRQLSFENSAVEGPAQSPGGRPESGENAAGNGRVSFSGSVTNGSGGSLPAGLKVTLRGFDGMQPVYTQEAAVQPDGSYTIPEVELVEGRVYFATVESGGVLFNSEVLRASDLRPGDEASLPLTIYDTSSDPSPLTAERVHIFFEFDKPNWLQVVELYILSNPTRQVIVPAAPGQPIFEIDLPTGYTNLQFEDGTLGERFVQTAGGFGDTRAILPDPAQHQILFAYELPYQRKLDLSLRMPLPAQAVVIAIPADGVRLQGSQLRDSGQRSVQGIKLQFYAASELKKGSSLDLSISGKPRLPGDTGGAGSLGGLFLGLGAFILAAAFAGWRYYQHWQQARRPAWHQAAPPDSSESVDALLDAIVALDDLYRAGTLPADVYPERRAELLSRLRAALDRRDAK